jgi:DNA (cytosine-5)-methyltransferase 1
MRELSLFSGAGGGLLASKLLGWTCVGYVENNEYCQKVLRQRIADGILDTAPIFGDIRKFISDGYAESYSGMVDVVSGGFPCQDISSAGTGEGIGGGRSGLWKEMAAVICVVRPKYIFVENSPFLLVRGFGTVLRDLASMGFDVRWGVLGASGCGGPVERKRIWITGSNKENGATWMGDFETQGEVFKRIRGKCPSFWLQAPSGNPRMVNGVADYMERVCSIGNGQVPIVAASAFKILSSGVI